MNQDIEDSIIEIEKTFSGHQPKMRLKGKYFEAVIPVVLVEGGNQREVGLGFVGVISGAGKPDFKRVHLDRVIDFDTHREVEDRAVMVAAQEYIRSAGIAEDLESLYDSYAFRFTPLSPLRNRHDYGMRSMGKRSCLASVIKMVRWAVEREFSDEVAAEIKGMTLVERSEYLQKVVDRRELGEEDIKELMYDLQAKHKFLNLKKPKPYVKVQYDFFNPPDAAFEDMVKEYEGRSDSDPETF